MGTPPYARVAYQQQNSTAGLQLEDYGDLRTAVMSSFALGVDWTRGRRNTINYDPEAGEAQPDVLYGEARTVDQEISAVKPIRRCQGQSDISTVGHFCPSLLKYQN